MHTLYSISYSPWSERARWALEQAEITYRSVNFIPMVTEPRVRWVLRRPTGRLTIPVLCLDDSTTFDDSFAIARWASQKNPDKLPLGETAAQLSTTAEQILSAGRVRTTYRALRDDKLLKASLPGFLKAAGPVGLGVGRFVARGLLDKYPSGDEAACLKTMHEGLEALRDAVGSKPTIEAQFSYADIVVATALAFVKPAPGRWARLPDIARLGWTEPELAEEFSDLLAWRDRLYEVHRKKR